MKNNIEWDADAEKLVDKAPFFMRKKIKQMIETEAVRQDLDTVTAAFVQSVREKREQQPGDTESSPAVTDDPLHKAFKKKYAIHAGMSASKEFNGSAAEIFESASGAPRADAEAVSYTHIPFCSSRCLFCGFYASRSRKDAIADYIDVLLEEIEFSGQLVRDTGRNFSAIYLGGGTPTDVGADDLSRLLHALKRHLPITDDCEITLEGRPFGFSDDKLEAALEAGANRFSFGVQCFNTDIRQRLGRKLEREEIIQRLNEIVEAAEPYQAAVVIDLIYGLPGQTIDILLHDIDTMARQTNIDGLDLYQINLIPGTPMVEQKSKLPPIPGLEGQADMYMEGRKRLVEHDFERLSVAHWRRSPREVSRYNSATKYGRECLPLGAGAGGRWGKVRCMQEGDVGKYTELVKSEHKPIGTALETPSNHKLISAAIGQLNQLYLDPDALDELSNGELGNKLLPLLRHWEAAGLISEGQPWRLTPAGEFWAVNLQQLISDKLQED